jgi:predicted Zn-dependent protease
MRYILFIITVITIQTNILSQDFKPSKEEQAKYENLIIEIIKKKKSKKGDNLNDILIPALDSLYTINPNSNYLKNELIQINLDLMYDSLIMERNPQTIAIFKSFINQLPASKKHLINPTLASVYRFSGDFNKAILLLEESLAKGSDREIVIKNLTATYLDASQNKKALKTVHLLDTSYYDGSWYSLLAEVYHRNNLNDSALVFINFALENKKTDYYTFVRKAKILEELGKTENLCPIIKKATKKLEEENTEYYLKKRDATNPFIKLLMDDVNEAKQLKEKYCK